MFEKIWDILKGENKDVHKTKNKYTAEMLKIHAQAKRQVVASERTVTMIENSKAYKQSIAYRYAKAAGRLKWNK